MAEERAAPTPDVPRERALVVDDHTYLRAAISSALTEGGSLVVAALASPAQARAHVQARGLPDLLVTELRFPTGSGIDLVRDLGAEGVRVVVLTCLEDDYSMRAAYAAGAAAYLLKSATHEEVLRALAVVRAGGTHIDASRAAVLVKGLTQRSPPQRASLTASDLEIVRLTADGLSNGQIATALATSAPEVKSALTRIGRTLGVSNRTEIVAVALRADLVR